MVKDLKLVTVLGLFLVIVNSLIYLYFDLNSYLVFTLLIILLYSTYILESIKEKKLSEEKGLRSYRP